MRFNCGLPVILFLMALPLWSNPVWGASLCTCKDMKDMRFRLNKITAALHAYDVNIRDYAEQAGRTGDDVPFSDEEEAALQGRVNTIMSTTTQPNGGHSFGAETDGDCQTTYDAAATPCLRAALEIHENVHRQRCKVTPFGGFVRPKNTTMIEFAQEEIRAYLAEQQFLADKLKVLLNSCFALFVERQATLNLGSVQRSLRGQANIPLQVNDDGSIRGQTDLVSVDEGRAGPCTINGSEHSTIMVSGTFDSDKWRLHLRTTWSGPGGSATGICPTPMGPIPGTGKYPPMISPNLRHPMTDGFDMSADIGSMQLFSVPATKPGVQQTVRVTVAPPVRQVEFQ